MFQSRFKEYEVGSPMVAAPHSTPFWKAQLMLRWQTACHLPFLKE